MIVQFFIFLLTVVLSIVNYMIYTSGEGGLVSLWCSGFIAGIAVAHLILIVTKLIRR